MGLRDEYGETGKSWVGVHDVKFPINQKKSQN